MLVAEIHGIYVPEARNSEDYLTSAVFGHLRYLAPAIFWQDLLSFATSLPVEGISNTTIRHITEKIGRPLSSYARVEVIFWPTHEQGVPDIVLHFSAPSARSVVVIVEAKLNASKSGVGEKDQLARYLRLLDSLGSMRPPLPTDAVSMVVYLTVVDSRNELIESLQVFGDTPASRRLLYQLQWQDIIRAIEQTQGRCSRIEGLVLGDVKSFLRKRGLEYFSGMDILTEVPLILPGDGELFSNEPLFELDSASVDTSNIIERWMNAD